MYGWVYVRRGSRIFFFKRGSLVDTRFKMHMCVHKNETPFSISLLFFFFFSFWLALWFSFIFENSRVRGGGLDPPMDIMNIQFSSPKLLNISTFPLISWSTNAELITFINYICLWLFLLILSRLWLYMQVHYHQSYHNRRMCPCIYFI